MFWFIVLLLVAGAGFYFYQKLTAIEREIRAEQDAEKSRAVTTAAVVEKEEPRDKPQEPVVKREPTVAETPVPDEFSSTEGELLAAVRNLPGIKQTELYQSFSDIEKKKFQKMVKKLADDGDLRREKQGNSYILFPA